MVICFITRGSSIKRRYLVCFLYGYWIECDGSVGKRYLGKLLFVCFVKLGHDFGDFVTFVLNYDLMGFIRI